jgi:nucleotide-binding universal stress UspA family protein
MIKKILVTLDSSPFTETAIRHTIEIGISHNAEVTGIAVVHTKKMENVGPVPIGAGHSAKNLRQFRLKETIIHIDEIMGKFESALSGSGLTYRSIREKGDPLRVMVSYATHQDLIITGARSILNYGVVEERQDLLCRMLNAGIGPFFAVGAEFNPIRRVLIAYDGSVNSRRALNKFSQLKIWPSVSIRIIYFGGEDEKSKKLLLDATEEFSAQGFSTESLSILGPAKKQLVKHAEEWSADLIVIGNRPRGLLSRQVFGDTTTYAIEHSEKALFLA